MVFNFVSDERFRKPVKRTELEEFVRSWASDNSRRNWCWSVEYLKIGGRRETSSF